MYTTVHVLPNQCGRPFSTALVPHAESAVEQFHSQPNLFGDTNLEPVFWHPSVTFQSLEFLPPIAARIRIPE